MEYAIGFIIAAFIALTGVGAGTITTPLLILFLGVPAPMAVATGLMFSAAVKLVLVPSQIARKQVSWRVLGFMLLGGLPGVLTGSLVLRHIDVHGPQLLLNGLLGGVLVLTALWQLFFSFRPTRTEARPRDHIRLLPILMFGVGTEVGFSSAGAGALGTAALLSLTSLSPAHVVGTDIVFGFLLSLVGSGAHGFFHGTSLNLLHHLIIGGLVGVVLGTVTAGWIPKRPLRFALWIWLLIIGSQFIYTNAYAASHPQSQSSTSRHADKAEGFAILPDESGPIHNLSFYLLHSMPALDCLRTHRGCRSKGFFNAKDRSIPDR
jgi:uncharacterized protein